MIDIRSVRKFIFNDVIVCIADELLEYLGIDNSIEYLIKNKNLNNGFDYEVIPRHLIDSKVNLSRLKDDNYVYILKQPGIYKIINKRRQSEAIDIANKFSIPVGFIKEREYVNIISKAFSEYKCTQQYFVPREDKKGYFIDLYIQGKDKNIAVEIDENGHNSYDEEFEIARENYIKEKLGCEFIRFNPDTKDFNIGTVINQIRSTTNQNTKTQYTYIDECIETIDIIEEAILELENENLSIIKFIDFLEIENINYDIGNKLKYEKDLFNDDNYVVLIEDIPILSTKHIANTYITKDSEISMNIDISYYHKNSNRHIDIRYTISKDKIHIELQGRLKSLVYIKDYLKEVSYNRNNSK